MGAVVLGAHGLWLHTNRRSDGWVRPPGERFATGLYALATSTLHMSSDLPSSLYARDWLGDVRIRGESTNPARPLLTRGVRRPRCERQTAESGVGIDRPLV